MKHRLLYIASSLVILAALAINVIQPFTASAASPCDPLIENCPATGGGSGGSGGGNNPNTGCGTLGPCFNPSPGNPSGRVSVNVACPDTMPGFPKPSDNLNASITATAFFQCETNWAKKTTGAYVPNTYTAAADPNGTGAIDYCHRTFTGGYLTNCEKGFNKNGQGSAQSVCGNDAACKVGFAAGGNGSLNPNVSGAGGGGGGGGGAGNNTPSCDSGDFSFNWALCPIFDGTNAVTNWIFTNLIQPLLMTNPICLDPTGNSCDNTIYNIWSGFRIYGDIFLVIVLLVIVFGESIGGGMIDAYTAKKVLPRLLIAAILINLSVYIVALAIDITNVVGGGLGQLLTAPLKGNGAFTIQPDGITQGAIAAFGATGLLVGGFVLGVSGIALLMVGLIITGAIAMVGIFVTLILRQTIILALLLISPVAFSLWCLPNTQSWFKRWWDTLFQMLLVYPMVIVLFAVADVMSYVTQHNGQGGVLSSIVAFMLLIIPLYLVPFTLRSSNRLLGAIHGAVSNVGRQVNSVTGRRAFSGAGQQAAKNWELMQTNRRFNANSKYLGGVNKRLNTALSNATSPGAAAKIYGGNALRRMGVENSIGKGIMNQIEETKFQHTQKLGERLNQLGFNDRALRTLMSMDDYSAGAIRQKAAELRASGNPNDRLAANQLESSAAFLSQTLYQDQEMGRADIGMAAGLAVTSQGFSNSNEVADLANRRGGQGSGLASAFVTQAQLNGQRAGMLDMKAGYGVQVGQDGSFMGIGAEGKSEEERNRAVAHQIKRIMTTGQSEIQSAKGGSVKAMAPGFEHMLMAAQGPTNSNGNYEFRYQNEHGQEEALEFSPQEVQRVAAMLGTAQADYSGTAAATSSEIDRIIQDSKLSGGVLEAYKRGKRDQDPSRVNTPSPPSGAEEEK